MAGLPAVTFGKTIKLSGHESLGGTQSVSLQDEVWPFTSGFQTVQMASSGGSYSFVVAPEHATRYRVMVGSQMSRVVTVYVL